ncbi:MAG: hypothetical protein ABR521_12645 [Gaiellaceae bacterium]
MPNYWVRTHSSPPAERLDELKAIAEKYHAEIVDNEIYTPLDELEIAYVLVRLNADQSAVGKKAMLEEMEAQRGTIELLDKDEAQEANNLLPPASTQQLS